jgi:flagellar basal body rod protein FlgB
MLFGFIDRASPVSTLKVAMDRSVERSRAIADRVAKATARNGDGFALTAPGGTPNAQANTVNIEEEMIALADEQVRALATSKLLEKAYASLRGAIKGGAV